MCGSCRRGHRRVLGRRASAQGLGTGVHRQQRWDGCASAEGVERSDAADFEGDCVCCQGELRAGLVGRCSRRCGKGIGVCCSRLLPRWRC